MSMLRAVSEQRIDNQDALRRIRGEYLEMPGLSLTVAQARRFWSLDHETCTSLLDALVGGGASLGRPMDGTSWRIALSERQALGASFVRSGPGLDERYPGPPTEARSIRYGS